MARQLRLAISYAMQQTCPLPVYYGFDYINDLIALRDRGEPFVFMDHAYFERGYDKGNFRVVLNGIHQTQIRSDLPGDRLARYCPFPRPWRTNGTQDIVIPIAPNHAIWHQEPGWTEKAQGCFPGSTVKEKSGTPLGKLLPDCRKLIAHSSVAAVEAAYFGIPVYGPEHSPAFQVGQPDFNGPPLYPDRDNWLRTLSYSQFSLDEIKRGFAWAVLREVWNGDQYVSGTKNLYHELE